MNSTIRHMLRLGSALAPLLMAAPAIAQDTETANAPEEQGIADIVVTAQRRAQNLQDVPVSVTAFDARLIREAGFTNSLSIGDQVPNLEIKTFGGVPNIFIRGVGNNDFNSSSIGPISVYRDDVVVASTGSQIFSLFDLERIEVLRGPQGTLFGKNTTGGAIQFFSKLPGDVFEGHARIGYGRFDLFEAEAAASIPLGDTLSVRVAGMVRRRDGERVNLFDGDDAINVDEAAARAIFRWRPDTETDIRFSVGGGRDRSDYLNPKPLGTTPAGTNIFGYADPVPNDIRILNFDADSRNHSDNVFASLNIARSFGDFTVKSITGYDDTKVDNRVDVDGSPLRVDQIKFLTDTWQFSQELQLAYDGPGFDGIVGLYYFRENLKAHSEADLIGELDASGGSLPVVTDATRRNVSFAAFAQGTYEVTPAFRVTLGGRYTSDKVRATHQAALVPGIFTAAPNGAPITLVPFARLKDKFNAFSWRVALDYDVAKDVLGYVSVNKGFKSGGFNIGIITSVAERTQVDPEYLTAYEAGLKTTLFDRRLRLNLSAFYYDYTDLQVLSVNQQGTGVPTLGLDNAADAEIKGLEFEATAVPVEGLDLGLNFGLLDATYKNYTSGALDPATGRPRDFSGNRLPGAPKFTLSTFAQYAFPVGAFEGRLRVEYNYTGKKFYNNAEDDLVSSRKGYGLLNLRATLSDGDGKWELAGWVKNVTGKDYIVDATDLRDFGFIPQYYGERPTWGLDLTFNF
jgi:iron complex outermembrane receptor protein